MKILTLMLASLFVLVMLPGCETDEVVTTTTTTEETAVHPAPGAVSETTTVRRY